MNRVFIFSNEADQQPVFIDLALLATGELFVIENVINMQFTEGLEGITVEFTTNEKASSEFLRLTTELQLLHDEMDNMEFMFVDISKDDDE